MSWADLQKKMAEAKPTSEETPIAQAVENPVKLADTYTRVDDELDFSRFKRPRSTPKNEVTEETDWGFDLEVVPEGQEAEDAMMASEPPISFEDPEPVAGVNYPDPFELPNTDWFKETQTAEEEVTEVTEVPIVDVVEPVEEPQAVKTEVRLPVTVEEEIQPHAQKHGYTDEVEETLLTLLESCLFQVVDAPTDFELEVVRSSNVIILTVIAQDKAMGKLLGKGGRYANAMRGACQSWWGKYRMRAEYSVNVARS